MLQSGRGIRKVGVLPKISRRATPALFISPPTLTLVYAHDAASLAHGRAKILRPMEFELELNVRGRAKRYSNLTCFKHYLPRNNDSSRGCHLAVASKTKYAMETYLQT